MWKCLVNCKIQWKCCQPTFLHYLLLSANNYGKRWHTGWKADSSDSSEAYDSKCVWHEPCPNEAHNVVPHNSVFNFAVIIHM